MLKNCKNHDVYWFAPKRKRPITYSTKATSSSIELIYCQMREEGYPKNEITHFFMLEYIERKKLIAYEEKRVLQDYINAGYGKLVMNLGGYAREWEMNHGA